MKTKILIVEDDAFINALTSDDLESAGYGVLSAYDADEAIAILENNVLKHLSDGKSPELLEKEINLMTRVHRSFISEETRNHKRGQFDSRADYFKHVDLQASELIDDDFDLVVAFRIHRDGSK